MGLDVLQDRTVAAEKYRNEFAYAGADGKANDDDDGGDEVVAAAHDDLTTADQQETGVLAAD